MEQLGSLFDPIFCRLHGALVVDGVLIHLSLIKADAPAVLDIDGWNDQHRARSFLRSGRSFPGYEGRSSDSFPGETGRRRGGPWQYWKQTRFPKLWSLRQRTHPPGSHNRSAQNIDNPHPISPARMGILSFSLCDSTPCEAL